MINWFVNLDSWVQALIGGLFTWFVTALGAGLVFFFKDIKKSILNMMLGFAAGIMVAASFWSLLEPALESAKNTHSNMWTVSFIVATGFLLGGLFIYIFDKTVPHMHLGKNKDTEGIPTKLKRTVLLVLAITLHNIPEGLAIGVAFGAVKYATGSNTIAAIIPAISLTLGIALQNFPEGAAVAIPLRQENLSRRKSFFYGQLSAIVEPISAVIGALLVARLTRFLPYALAFAAGAMIYVVVEELIPEAQQTQTTKGAHQAVFGFMVGFAIMMILDVALG